MFDLKQAIAKWRRQMQAGGIQDQPVLEELESHLREDFGTLVSSGMTEAQAFQLAASRIGGPTPLRAEFKKLENAAYRPVVIGSWLWTGAVLLLALLLSRDVWAGKPDLLLYLHTISLTVGYGAAFLAGAFGMCYIGHRSFQTLTPVRQKSLGRAVSFFNVVAAGLVVVGLMLGMFWRHRHLDGYWGGSPREIGGLTASLWVVALLLIQRSGRAGERASMLLNIAGNVVISLAWFGAGMVAAHAGLPDFGLGRYWPAEVFLGIHLVFLVIGLKPVRATAES